MRTIEEKKIPYEHYSARFAKRLFKRYPAWKEYAGHTMEGTPGYYLYYLTVSVPSPNSAVAAPLVISTNVLREVTLSWFEGWHVHIFAIEDETDEKCFSRVFTYIDRLISEKQLAAVWYQGEVGIAGYSLAAEEVVPPEMLPGQGRRLVIRSWHGTHDREIIGTG